MLDGSRERLHTDVIDIYWIHNPMDVEKYTPMLIPLAKNGQIRRIGVSNHNLAEIKRANAILGTAGLKISAVQNHYSLMNRSSETSGILDYWGDYPYLIEDNYFSQGNLETKPGVYRQITVAMGSFEPNDWGLYDMHGNVGEWVWDWYDNYETDVQTDPTDPASGTRRVYRGGGWNDFAKNLRSAYRATLPPDNSSFNLGLRLVRNAGNGSGNVESSSAQANGQTDGNILIAYFSWGGNTRGIATEIQSQTGAELFEIQMITPYSTDYNTVLDQAQEAQNAQDRPELSTHVEDMDQYDTVILGYPNWWASIPMPVASFLEEYDFSGKTIIPFCSHGGGRFGQSLTAITKLAPDAVLGEGLAVSYSGGSGLPDDITAWLEENNILPN